MSAIVCHINKIEPHVDPRTNEVSHSLEIITLTWPLKSGEIDLRTICTARIVTGPHYRVGQKGVYIEPGQQIPGYLAEDLWMVGSGNANRWFPIVEKNMRGVASPGIFCGREFQKTRAAAWEQWLYWRDRWKEGEDVGAYLGVIPA